MPEKGRIIRMAQHVILYKGTVNYRIMKKIGATVLLCILLGLTGITQTKTINNLVGAWEAIDHNNQDGGLEVIDSAQIFLVYGEHKLPVVDYYIDFSKHPCWFDFTVKEDSSFIKMHSLIQFVNDNLLQWQIFDGDVAQEDKRPVYFATDRGEMIYLKRKKVPDLLLASKED